MRRRADFDSDTIWIENKSDLAANRVNRNESIRASDYRVSALTGDGMPELLAVLANESEREFGSWRIGNRRACIVISRHCDVALRMLR